MGSPDYPTSEERVVELAGAMYDRGHNPAGIVRQMHAISASGDRTEALESLQVPTTVLHGSQGPAGPAGRRHVPPPRRSPVPACGSSRAWATTCRATLWPDFVDEIAANAERGGASHTAPARTV